MIIKMAAKMNRETSTKDVVNSILDDYEKLTRQLFENLSVFSLYRGKNDASEGDTTEIVNKLTEKDKELQAAIKIAKEQMDCQLQIQVTKENMAKKDQEILRLENQLKETEQILSQAVFQAKKKLKAIEQANRGSVSSEELIKYAHKISSSSAVEAPTTWMPGDQGRPYPLDIEMRSGLLGKLGEGLDTIPASTLTMDGTSMATTTSLADDGIINGQSTVGLSWQSHLQRLPNTIEQDTTSDGNIGAANGRPDHAVTEEAEIMSSSSSSSSSDSP
ncbi:mediator of RNA polymerase II transcription subunit 4-like [Actinia tenebrosa]|uniref:Mediator of RNA polymerase II transcription subunit 4 n=1 Tax=Actinia tenebrosa TaxID=6105 RepID=A0A6P8H8P1_ACTTE|nr:mediator of RNA polymerase II transcription subunit 4-like [Actinia tenebrosa]